jgi:hypothetical protein
MPGLAAERQDELIITRGAPSAVARSVQRRCVAGELARLAPGLYVSDRDPQAQAALVREHWVRILGELVPGAVVSYRSAYGAAPAEGVLILSHPSRFNRTIRLPGLRVALVKGPGALPGDAPLGHGALHLASMQRMLLENLTRPRGADGRSRGEAAVRQRLEQILAAGDGALALDRVRSVARSLASPLNMSRELVRLEHLIDELLSPPEDSGSADAAAGTGAGEADPDCVAMLQALAHRLRRQRWPRWEAVATGQPDRAHQALLEAWFECFDAAPVPAIRQACADVLAGKVGLASDAPMRELLSVFKLAASSPLSDSVPPFGDWFAQGMRARHALLMRLVEPVRAGRFRTRDPSAPAAAPVPGRIEPERIEGTLAAGSKLAIEVPEGLARAIFYSILLCRVQPFDRGSDKLAHLLMNAELSSVGEARIVVPTRMREHLQIAGEQLLRQGDPERYSRLLVALQRWSAALDFSDLNRLLARLAAMRAFDRAPAPPVTPRP